MKILWITTRAMGEHAELLRLPGSMHFGWIEGLADAMRHMPELTLAVASPAQVPNMLENKHDGITFFTIREKYPDADLCQVMSRFSPDAVHLHGTSSILTHNCGTGNVPWIISMEGILESLTDWLNGNLLDADLPFSPKNFLLRRSFATQRHRWRKRSEIERNAVAGAQHVIGRTKFDHTYAARYNPHAAYWCVNEILRKPFYLNAGKWRYDSCRKHSILIPSMAYPLKGAHVMLKAMAILRRDFPDVTLSIPGSGPRRKWPFNNPYPDYLLNLIRDNSLSGSVNLLPPLNAEQMAEAMLRSNVFVLPSFMENSPNSLAEAQLLGVPTVASNVGGISDFLDKKHTVQSGDAILLADAISDVLTSEAAIEQETSATSAIAAKRHAPEANATIMLNIYRRICKHDDNLS